MANRLIPGNPYQELQERVEDLEGGVSGVSLVMGEIPDGDINGINLIFTSDFDYISGSIEAFLNGIRIREGASNDYVESSSNTITLNYAPLPGDNIEINYRRLIETP